jgi:hypothetical protein
MHRTVSHDESVVFVLGAGASAGESLKVLGGGASPVSSGDLTTPVTTGFFKRELYEAVGYRGEKAESDFPLAFSYIRTAHLLTEAVGQGNWASLNLEELFTSIELDLEFQGAESDAGAKRLLIRNELVRYIGRVLALCTHHKYGENYRRLQSRLKGADSAITFNYDLLYDQELQRGHPEQRVAVGPYGNFFARVFQQPFLPDSQKPEIFLKMHGSLNWFQCTNSRCPGNTKIHLEVDAQRVLDWASGATQARSCSRCGSEMIPLLIPPLLKKPISENWITRAVWGLAKETLARASKVVVVGFSAAETDFYARWLLRAAVGMRREVEVLVVDPNNDDPGFKQRMNGIFPRGWIGRFRTFNEIDDILNFVGRPTF